MHDYRLQQLHGLPRKRHLEECMVCWSDASATIRDMLGKKKTKKQNLQSKVVVFPPLSVPSPSWVGGMTCSRNRIVSFGKLARVKSRSVTYGYGMLSNQTRSRNPGRAHLVPCHPSESLHELSSRGSLFFCDIHLERSGLPYPGIKSVQEGQAKLHT